MTGWNCGYVPLLANGEYDIPHYPIVVNDNNPIAFNQYLSYLIWVICNQYNRKNNICKFDQVNLDSNDNGQIEIANLKNVNIIEPVEFSLLAIANCENVQLNSINCDCLVIINCDSVILNAVQAKHAFICGNDVVKSFNSMFTVAGGINKDIELVNNSVSNATCFGSEIMRSIDNNFSTKDILISKITEDTVKCNYLYDYERVVCNTSLFNHDLPCLYDHIFNYEIKHTPIRSKDNYVSIKEIVENNIEDVDYETAKEFRKYMLMLHTQNKTLQDIRKVLSVVDTSPDVLIDVFALKDQSPVVTEDVKEIVNADTTAIDGAVKEAILDLKENDSDKPVDLVFGNGFSSPADLKDTTEGGDTK